MPNSVDSSDTLHQYNYISVMHQIETFMKYYSDNCLDSYFDRDKTSLNYKQRAMININVWGWGSVACC